MKKIGLFLLGILTLTAALVGYFFYAELAPQKSARDPIEKIARERKDYQEAAIHLEAKDYVSADFLIRKHLKSIENQGELSDKWFHLFIRLNAETGNIAQLEELYQFDPVAFLIHEDASLRLAHSWLDRGRLKELEQLRLRWLGKEKKQPEWQLLDAEALILEGNRDQAISVLESQHFEGSKDSPRLVQLALLHLSQNPKKAWGYLEIANDKDPNNPTILTYRAKLLESIGQHELAEKEYAAAVEADRENLARNDQLIEFHLRNEQVDQAIDVLQEALNHPHLNEELAVKALFWNRMVKPFGVDWKTAVPSRQDYPLYNYLVTLPPSSFWSEPSFNRLPNNKHYAERLQAVWWLRLLSALETDNAKAMKMIEDNPFAHISWNPSLELAFKRILNYRLNGKLYLPREQGDLLEKDSTEDTPHQEEEFLDFFEELDRLALQQLHNPSLEIDEKTNRLLKNNEAFVAALMAAGWYEAAIEMHTAKPAASGLPDWFNRQYAIVLQANRGLGGVEQRARQAHYAGDIPTAQMLYTSILEQSTEAKSYLARQAFIDQQWEEARELTIQLLKEYPDNQQLWDNLKRIEAMLKTPK